MLPQPIAAHSSSPRIAAEAFLSGSTHGWGRRDLAEWLVCHYGVCVRPIENSEESGPRVVIALPDSRRWVEERGTRVDEGRVERLVRDAREATIHLLYDLGDPETAGGVTRLAIARGLVGEALDGGRAWVPVDRKGLSLVDRVASLLVADYLNAPLDYRGVVICQRCGGIGRAGEDAHAEGCQPKRCESGVHEIDLDEAPPTLRSPSMTG